MSEIQDEEKKSQAESSNVDDATSDVSSSKAPGSNTDEKTASSKGSSAGENKEASKEGEPAASPATEPDSPEPEASKAEAAPKSEVKSSDPKKPRKRKKGEKVDLTNARIGFLGAGKMTEALAKGLLTYTKIDNKRIFVSSKTGKNHEHFKQQGITVTKRNYDIFARNDCDIVFLAFHGFVIRQLYKTGGTRPLSLTTNYIPNQRHPVYLLSLVGGVNLNDIKHTLLNPDNPDKYKIEMHRIMVNSSVAYGIGLGAIDIEPDSKKCSPIIRDLLTSFAKVEHIPENNMDVACAVGGNGLAFCYYFLSAISDGGFKMGLPKQMAVKLAAKTLQSAAGSLLESGKHPSDLRDQCTSPSGPAIYGVHVLDKADCASGIAAAVEAAFKRIKELVETVLV